MDALPADIRAKAEKVLADSGSDAAAVVRYLLGAPGPARAATKLENFPERWPISQLLPTRRAVNFGMNAKQLATFNEKDGVVSAEGDFSTYNVFLMLPLPRRPLPPRLNPLRLRPLLRRPRRRLRRPLRRRISRCPRRSTASSPKPASTRTRSTAPARTAA